MRLILALLVSLATLPALAQSGWTYYGNARFGYELAVPPGFEGQGQSGNGDGQVFTLENRVARLTVWGGYLVTAPDFEAEANTRLASDLSGGWGLTAQSTTPTWASWSATKSGRVLHQHMIQLCDEPSYAALRLEYAQADRPRLDGFVEALLASLKPVC